MASKNSLKQYVEQSYYHIYNRGVEKRNIFLDPQDYGVFLSYLKDYLSEKDEKELLTKLGNPSTSYKEKEKILKMLKLNNFYNEITLLAYCLMQNHFHLLVKQSNASSIDKFMNSLALRYAIYFNKRYKRIGPLFQDVYKAVRIESEEQLLHLSRYIHQNPANMKLSVQTFLSQPSSYPEYLGHKKTNWVKTENIIDYFSKNNPNLSYQTFVEQSGDILPIQLLLLE